MLRMKAAQVPTSSKVERMVDVRAGWTACVWLQVELQVS